MINYKQYYEHNFRDYEKLINTLEASFDLVDDTLREQMEDLCCELSEALYEIQYHPNCKYR